MLRDDNPKTTIDLMNHLVIESDLILLLGRVMLIWGADEDAIPHSSEFPMSNRVKSIHPTRLIHSSLYDRGYG